VVNPGCWPPPKDRFGAGAPGDQAPHSSLLVPDVNDLKLSRQHWILVERRLWLPQPPQLTRFSTSVVVASGTPGSYRNPIAISPTPPLGSTRRNPLVIPPTPTPPPGSRHQPSSIFADLSRAQLDTIIAIYRAFKISNHVKWVLNPNPWLPIAEMWALRLRGFS
jgi:hypothetical protein